MILRALLLGLLNAIRRLFHTNTATKRDPPDGQRPAQGPAHPWIRFARIASPIPERAVARPARPPLPPHLAALLAAAPEVEPELQVAARPAPPSLLQTFRSIAAHVRIYNPKPPAADRRRREGPTASWAERLASAVHRFGSLLALDGPPRAPTLG